MSPKYEAKPCAKPVNRIKRVKNSLSSVLTIPRLTLSLANELSHVAQPRNSRIFLVEHLVVHRCRQLFDSCCRFGISFLHRHVAVLHTRGFDFAVAIPGGTALLVKASVPQTRREEIETHPSQREICRAISDLSRLATSAAAIISTYVVKQIKNDISLRFTKAIDPR